jgi:Uma2 family endonuclease
MLDVLDKVRFYLDNGVRLVWLIDPRARTVMVWRSPAGAELLREQDTLDGGDVIPGFAVAVREVLPPPDNAESPEPPRGQLGADDGVASAEG